MADTETAVLGLLLMETGGDSNVWGDNLNDQVIQYIEDKLVGRTPVSTTGGTTTLVQADCRVRHIDITGVLSGDATIVVPNASNGWIVNNATSGAFGVVIKTSGGSASCTVPQGTSKHVDCDGSNVVQRSDRDIVGEMFFHAGATAPNGALECDGTAVKRTRAPELYAALGTTWGAGNGVDDFVLPDGKTAGKFLRARTGSVTVGTAQTELIKSHVHPVTGVSVSSNGAHTHTGATGNESAHTHSVNITDPGHTHKESATIVVQSGGGAGVIGQAAGGTADTGSSTTGITASSGAGSSHSHSISSDGAHVHALSGDSDNNTGGGAETRPTNIVGMLCIRL